MYIKTLLFIALSAISPLLANSMTISDNITIEKGNYATLLTSGTCDNNATTPSFTWVVNEHLDDGVFSTEDIFYFLPNVSWGEGAYHIDATMLCAGEADTTKQVIVTIFDQNCTHFTSDGTCVRYQVDSSKWNLYLKHGNNAIFNLKHLQYHQFGGRIIDVSFLPYSDNSYSIFWTPYSHMTDNSLHMKRLLNGVVITTKYVVSLRHGGSNPDITLLKNDNFIVHWCYRFNDSKFGLYDNDGNEINTFQHSSVDTIGACSQRHTTPAQITPLNDGGFTYSFADYNNTFDSAGNPLF